MKQTKIETMTTQTENKFKKISNDVYSFRGYRIRRFRDSKKKGIRFVKMSDNVNTQSGIKYFYSYVVDLVFSELNESDKLKFISCIGTQSEIKNTINNHIKYINTEIKTNRTKGFYTFEVVEKAKI